MANMARTGLIMRAAQFVMVFVAGFLTCALLMAHYELDQPAVSPSVATVKLRGRETHSKEEVKALPSTSTHSKDVKALPVKPLISDYWNYCAGKRYCPVLQPYGLEPANERFLLFDVRGAGWNNNRQSLELGYAMAFLWRRTLVLPEWLGNPCDPSDLQHVNTSFDVADMARGVKTISASEFVAYAKANPQRFPGGVDAVSRFGILNERVYQGTDWRKGVGWYAGLEGVVESLFPDIPELVPHVLMGDIGSDEDIDRLKSSQQFISFQAQRNVLSVSPEQAKATALYIGPRKLLGNFYSMIFVADPVVRWQVGDVIRRAVHLRSEFFIAADAVMKAAGLKPGEYGAIHNRQGDFELAYKNFYLDPKNPHRFLSQPQNRDFLSRHGKLYIAIKAFPPQLRDLKKLFLPALRREMAQPQSIGYLDMFKDVATPIVGHIKGWQGIVDMIICAQARTFIGSYASTFTGYIHRLRGYMPFVNDKRILFTDASKNGELPDFPSWREGANAGMIAWIREWPEGFRF